MAINPVNIIDCDVTTTDATIFIPCNGCIYEVDICYNCPDGFGGNKGFRIKEIRNPNGCPMPNSAMYGCINHWF